MQLHSRSDQLAQQSIHVDNESRRPVVIFTCDYDMAKSVMTPSVDRRDSRPLEGNNGLAEWVAPARLVWIFLFLHLIPCTNFLMKNEGSRKHDRLMLIG